MNITRGVSHDHILSRGFKVFETIEGNDMGQMSWSIPQYQNEKCKIVGGYWVWKVEDNNGKELLMGWWNSDEEFDREMSKLDMIKI